MANYFSDHLAAAPGDTYSANFRRDATKTHARLRKKIMTVNTGAVLALNDTAVLGTFKSGDRLFSLKISTNSATTTTGDIDLGLYKADFDHAPVAANEIDVDLFADAYDINAAIRADVDVFTNGVLSAIDRGKTLWELATVGAGSYTVDPMEDWDLVMTVVEATTAAQIIRLEADFVSFG